MIFNDLRHFISTINEIGQLKVVEGASCELEIGAITEVASLKKSCPAVLFDSINCPWYFARPRSLPTTFS